MKKFFTLALFLFLATPCLAEMVSVTHQPAELRDRAMVARSNILRQLPRYTPLEVIESGRAYLKVKTADGVSGYIHKSLTENMSAVIVTGSICNVRSGPGTEFPIAFKAHKGANFKVNQQAQGWVQISSSEGKTGWIWKDLVWGE